MAEEREAAPSPRAFWSGTLTFGLVSVPVDLYPAVRSRRTRAAYARPRRPAARAPLLLLGRRRSR